VRSRVRHSSSTTRRAPATTFAGESQDAILATIVAVQAKKAMFGNATGQVVPEFPLYKMWDRAVPRLLSGKEGLQLFRDDLIQQRRFRMARPVRDVDSHVDSHEGVA
jgi:hypothetical protein